MVSSNQRSINEGIRKVIGSSNRSFATTDPERQPRIVTQPARPAPAGARADPSSATQARESVRGRQGNVAATGSGKR
jgi:hypothetical protein